MVIVLFRSELSAQAGADYRAMADEMLDLAKRMPGFVDFRHYESPEGERLAAIWWESQGSMAAWRSHARHLVAQRLGREKWYQWFRVDVAEVVRSYGFDRDA